MSEKMVNILHVEDDEVDAMVMQRALKKTNLQYSYHHASNGLEALDMLRGTNGKTQISPLPNVIILDLNMPQMNGHEFMRELRADPALTAIAVHVLSTSNDERDRIEAYKNHAAGYIIKPVNLESYVEAISTLNRYWQLVELP